MSPPDGRSTLLHAFDNSVSQFAAKRSLEVEAGRAFAEEEIKILSGLADDISQSVVDWGVRLEAIDLDRPFSARRAGALIVESVFDEVLAPEAFSVLSATVALAGGPD